MTDGQDTGALDVLVLGSGVAGLSAAVRLAAPMAPAGAGAADGPTGLRVGVLTKAELSQSATRWAQGGVAAVLGGDEDSTDLHLADTLAAGAGLCDTDAVRVLVDEGPFRVHELIAMGAVFDRQPGGALALAREGGHSTARVVHAGGAATGAEVERALVDATRARAAAVLEEWFALDLLVEGGRCRGVRALSADGQVVEVRATHTVLATGGAGQLFAVTTNPAEATADGLAMALRAGVPVADVEFMQFHPTALHHPAMPRPLLSEALRGHGALLRDARGDRFVDELAPRDVVSRAMADRMREQGVESLWLDATGLAAFDSRFPTIAASLHGHRPRSLPRLAAHRPRRPLPVGRGAHRPVRGHRAARPVGRRRGGLHRGARRQPAGVQLAPGGDGVRRPPGRGHRRPAADGPSPTGAMGACSSAACEPVDLAAGGAGRAAARPRGPDPAADGDLARRGQDQGRAPADHDRGGRRGAQRRRRWHRRCAPSRPSPRARRGVPVDRAQGELANLVTAATSVLPRPRCGARPAAPTPAVTSPSRRGAGAAASSTPPRRRPPRRATPPDPERRRRPEPGSPPA